MFGEVAPSRATALGAGCPPPTRLTWKSVVMIFTVYRTTLLVRLFHTCPAITAVFYWTSGHASTFTITQGSPIHRMGTTQPHLTISSLLQCQCLPHVTWAICPFGHRLDILLSSRNIYLWDLKFQNSTFRAKFLSLQPVLDEIRPLQPVPSGGRIYFLCSLICTSPCDCLAQKYVVEVGLAWWWGATTLLKWSWVHTEDIGLVVWETACVRCACPWS